MLLQFAPREGIENLSPARSPLASLKFLGRSCAESSPVSSPAQMV